MSVAVSSHTASKRTVPEAAVWLMPLISVNIQEDRQSHVSALKAIKAVETQESGTGDDARTTTR